MHRPFLNYITPCLSSAEAGRGSQQLRRGSPGIIHRSQNTAKIRATPAAHTDRDQTRVSSEFPCSGASPDIPLHKSCWDRPPQDHLWGTLKCGAPSGPPQYCKKREHRADKGGERMKKQSKHNPEKMHRAQVGCSPLLQ